MPLRRQGPSPAKTQRRWPPLAPCLRRGTSGSNTVFALASAKAAAELADLLWLECNAAELNGVSFSKGCFVGQENTARMNWRQKVNRRLVVVEGDGGERARTVYPDLGLAVVHARADAIPPERHRSGMAGGGAQSSLAKARTGKVPMPFTLGGTAEKRNPRSGNRPSRRSDASINGDVDEPFLRAIRHSVANPMPAQMTLRAADGIAPFQPGFKMKPAAPRTFIH